MAKINLKLLKNLTLLHGKHNRRAEGMCALEAVAFLAGEEHSDVPSCCCPVIASVVRSWNDGMGSDDATRTRILAPLLPKMIGTKSDAGAAGDAIMLQRMWLALDWQIRVYAPAFLRVAGLADAADALAALPEVNSQERLTGAAPATKVAQDQASAAWSAAWSAAESAAESAARSAAESAAWSAAWSAARSAARSAAESAARSAAWSAAESAAWSAAWSAARSAAWSAAWSAARSAAESAARSAAKEPLAPVVGELQARAADLVLRMCAIKPAKAKVKKSRARAVA